MKLTGEHRFESRREQVWEALLEADVLSRCLPGFERLEKVADNEYEGALNIRVGPVQGQFQGRLSLSDLVPPSGYTLAIKGQGSPGFVDGKGSLDLEDQQESTLLRYDMEVQVGGKIAGVGQRLLDSSARSLSAQALTALGNIVQARSESSSEDAPTVIPQAPSQAEFAAKVAKDVAADLVPPARRPVMITMVLVAAAVLVLLLLRTCGS